MYTDFPYVILIVLKKNNNLFEVISCRFKLFSYLLRFTINYRVDFSFKKLVLIIRGESFTTLWWNCFLGVDRLKI